MRASSWRFVPILLAGCGSGNKGQPDAAVGVDLVELGAELQRVDTASAKFDLLVELREQRGR